MPANDRQVRTVPHRSERGIIVVRLGSYGGDYPLWRVLSRAED